jgi:methylmalonyl-CoA/ethylmalonyl-CoA epimerase
MTPLANLAFHHLGLAVKDDTAALVFLSGLGYAPGERLYDPLQNVFVRLCVAQGRPTVEIVQPGEQGASPVDSVVARFNEMIYHTCYEVEDLDAVLAEMKALGLRVQALGERKPAILFAGRHVSFHRIQGVGIVELLEPS